jgi:hypothetical protein|tara:strand:- start:49076 stop:49339 length:264 start_codon:yes stop_codon:yes gene_type:complete
MIPIKSIAYVLRRRLIRYLAIRKSNFLKLQGTLHKLPFAVHLFDFFFATTNVERCVLKGRFVLHLVTPQKSQNCVNIYSRQKLYKAR